MRYVSRQWLLLTECKYNTLVTSHFSITPALATYKRLFVDKLHWFDVPDRVFFKLAVTVYRCLNGRAPPCLSDYCVTTADANTRQHLRSANRQLLALPRYRLNTYGRRAFSVAGPTVWNSLPDYIRDPTISADCFRRLFKTYLFA